MLLPLRLIIFDKFQRYLHSYNISHIYFLIVYIITFLEVAIAFLQAYVFTVLLCLYIKDLYVAH